MRKILLVYIILNLKNPKQHNIGKKPKPEENKLSSVWEVFNKTH